MIQGVILRIDSCIRYDYTLTRWARGPGEAQKRRQERRRRATALLRECWKVTVVARGNNKE
jgi:hypothetical protein